MTNVDEHFAEKMKNPEFKKEYEKMKDLDNLDNWISVDKLKEKYRKENPQTYKEYACIVDKPYGQPDCVWDLSEQETCSQAIKGIKRNECKYWILKERTAEYTDEQLWEWLAKNLPNPPKEKK